MKKKIKKTQILCPDCGSRNYYTNKKERVCRACRHRGKKEDFVFEMIQKAK